GTTPELLASPGYCAWGFCMVWEAGSPTRRPLLPLNAGTAEPVRVSPPEAVAYLLELCSKGGNNQVTVGPRDGAGAEGRQRATSLQSGAARVAVLGINDGLVTNTSLILGIVGATATPQVVQLTGLASLVAGAASMAEGEYISMRAQVDLFERLLEEEREAIRTDPHPERAILQET